MLELNINDFTEKNYRRLLEVAKERFQFVFFDKACLEIELPHVLWRHDVDFSVHRALCLARIEEELGCQSTYFFEFHSEFYNIMERGFVDRVREIVKLGHKIGLHFDQQFYQIKNQLDLENRVSFETEIMKNILDCEIEAISFHNPVFDSHIDIKKEKLNGLVNTYGNRIFNNYHYVSDSNGYWRFERLENVLKDETVKKLQVLTHPVWWVPNPANPRERVERCIQGRAKYMSSWYDNFRKAIGLTNV